MPLRITLTVKEIRDYLDGAELEDLTSALDQAQGDAQSNNDVQSIIITVTPDQE